MATDSYISHLKARLAKIDAGIATLHERLHATDGPDKAEALAELAQLKVRHDSLAQRISGAEAKGTEDWSALHESFQEEADALRDTLERWLTRLD